MTNPLRIAVIGRPNVGKSTLFNRMVGKKLALVDNTPGVTRDRRYGKASIAGLGFDIIDTAGMDEGDDGSLTRRMLAQTREAMQEADGIFFVIDARAGLMALDETYAQEARRTGKPIMLIINKAEGKAAQEIMPEIYQLGFEHTAFISAEHGEGFADLFDAMRDALGEEWIKNAEAVDDAMEEKRKAKRQSKTRKPAFTPDASADKAAGAYGRRTAYNDYLDETDEETEENSEFEEDEFEEPDIEPGAPVEIAILGRPNAGKSTLINALIGEDRLLTGPEAGITRDSIGLPFEFNGEKFKLVDTAGMRKRSKITDKLEKLAVSDGVRAMRYAQVVVLLLDAHNPLEKQDVSIAALAAREGRALVIAVNKWDRVTADKAGYLNAIRDMLGGQLSQISGVPLVTLSALKGHGLDGLMKAISHTYEVWNKRVPTSALNRWIEDVTAHHSPPLVKGRRLKVKYVSQVKTRPPTFTLHCNISQDFPESYLRYLTGALRRDFDLTGTPIRLIVKASKNPYAGRAKKKKRG